MTGDASATQANEPHDGAARASVSRKWIVLGSLAMLLGLVMGFVMSSLGK